MKFKTITAKFILAASLLATGIAFNAANAGVSLSTAVRTSQMDAIVAAAGSGSKIKIYGDTGSGCSVPSGVAAAPGGCTLQATLTMGATVGAVSSGVLTIGAVSSQVQTAAGTPRFFHITTSGDVVVARIDACGSAPCWTFTGAVALGQNITVTGVTITATSP